MAHSKRVPDAQFSSTKAVCNGDLGDHDEARVWNLKQGCVRVTKGSYPEGFGSTLTEVSLWSLSLGDFELDTDSGKHLRVRCDVPAVDDVDTIVVYIPGIGGVGPCCAPGETFDKRALFPLLANALSTAGVAECYRISWKTESQRPGFIELANSVCELITRLVEHGTAMRPKRRIVLVGHSFGGSVAFRVARMLGEGHLKQVLDVVGIVALATQSRGATREVALLHGVQTLFLHGWQDAVMEPKTSAYLYNLAPGPKELRMLEACGHDFFPYKDELVDALFIWISNCCPPA